jgi:hypothetical protein
MAALISLQMMATFTKLGSPRSGLYYNVPNNSIFPQPSNDNTNLWLFDLTNDPTEYNDLSRSTNFNHSGIHEEIRFSTIWSVLQRAQQLNLPTAIK